MVGELVAFRLYPSQLTIASAGPTTGRIAPIGRSDQTGYKIRQDGTCEIGLKHDERRVRVMEMGLLEWGRLRWRSVDQEGNQDQLGNTDQGDDRDCDQCSGMCSRSGWCGAHHVTRDQQGDRDQGVIEISNQVCVRDHVGVQHTM